MSEGGSTTDNWYEATRVASPERARLNYDFDVDVCVIGAGLAGLTVAREVARRGWSTAVLEASRVAWAASGRNTGFVLPGFHENIEGMVERIGLDHTAQLWRLSEQGLDYVRNTIEETGMPGTDPVPGWLHVSQTDNEIGADVERLRWIGVDVEAWPAARVRVISAPCIFRAPFTFIRSTMRWAWLPLPKQPAPAFSRRRRRSRSIRPVFESVLPRREGACVQPTWCLPATFISAR
jgi:phytoene dehydrogenase-like protein